MGDPEVMPKANRHYIPGHVCHITHRCHKKESLQGKRGHIYYFVKENAEKISDKSICPYIIPNW